MGKFEGIRCDQCNKIEETKVSDVVPIGWIESKFRLVVGELKVVVCGKKCLIKYTRERDKIDKDLRELDPEEFCHAHCTPGDDQEQSGFHHQLCSKAKFAVR